MALPYGAGNSAHKPCHACSWAGFYSVWRNLSPPRVLILAWIAGLLGTSYTPALAAPGYYFKFSFCWYLCGQRVRGVERKSFYGFRCGLIRLTFGLCSFSTRGDIRLTPQSGHSAEFFPDSPKSVLSPLSEYTRGPLLLLFSSAFFVPRALTGRLGFIKWITAGWFLGSCLFFSHFSGLHAI